MLQLDHAYQKSMTNSLKVQKILILLEYSDNYSIISGNLWNHYRDEVNDDVNENNDSGN